MCFTRKPPGIEAGLVGLLFVVVINVVGGVVDDIDDVVRTIFFIFSFQYNFNRFQSLKVFIVKYIFLYFIF